MESNLMNDVEMLIESVEKRPPLYLKSLKEYSDIILKKRLWQEVCLEIVPGWAELDPENKRKMGVEVQNKWKNLRTCFSRELKAQRTKSGQAAVKRRKYIYFEKLLFLKSSLSQRPTESNVVSSDHEEDSREEEPMHRPKIRKNKKNPNVTFQEALLRILKDDLDEDKNFALSLVPALKSLNDNEKFQVKIEFLQVLQRIKANRISTYQGNCINELMQPAGNAAGYSGNNFNAQFSDIQRIHPSTSHFSGDFETSTNNFCPSPEIDVLDLS